MTDDTDPTTPRTPQRVAAIDGLRGILAVIVMLWHVVAPFGFSWMLAVANLSVALFFVLSGYVLTRSWNNNLARFFARRIVRLWPVFALCLSAGYLIAGISPVWTHYVWFPLIGPDDKPAIDPPMWSLFLEVWAMPFMPMIVWAGSSSILRALLVSGALALLGLIMPQIAILALFVAGAFLAADSFRNRALESPIPQWLGKISYSLYLSHALVLTVAVKAFGPWGGVACVPVALLVAHLIWWGVERPSIWLSRHMFDRKLYAGLSVVFRPDRDLQSRHPT